MVEATTIVAQARSGGLDTVDTAIAYGDSEIRLGQIGVSGWRVVSKLPALPLDSGDVHSWVQRHVSDSLSRLKVQSLHGLLLHRSADLLGPGGDDLYSAMLQLKSQSLVNKIGVSIYGPEELDALDGRFVIDLVQAPFNVLDRRLETSGWLNRLNERNAEVHTRSAFLQGLLLMKQNQRPMKFGRWRSIWTRWDQWLEAAQQSSAEACLGFPLQYPEIDRVVVGVDSVAHLTELLAAAAPGKMAPPVEFSTKDLDLIDPSRWSSL